MTQAFDQSSIANLWSRLDGGAAAEVLDALSGRLNEASPVVLRTLLGLAQLDAGKPAEAATTLRTVLAVEPENPVAGQFLVLALFRSGETKEAGTQLLHRCVLHPHPGFLSRFLETFWPLRFEGGLGLPLFDVEGGPTTPGEDPEIAAWLASAEGLDRDRMEPPTGEQPPGELKRHLGEMKDSEGRLVRAGRALADARFKRGIREYFREKPGLALKEFEKAWRVRPLNEGIAAHFAYLSFLGGKPAGGLAAVEPIVERALAVYDKSRDPFHLPAPDTLVCMAWCLGDLRRPADALRVLSLVHPEGPEDYGSHAAAAVSWLMLDHREEFRRALRISMGPFFIDTWEQFLRPFVRHVGRWLERDSPLQS